MRSATLRIETERLALRPFSIDDASNLAQYAGDLDVAKMTAMVPHPYPVIAAEGFIMLTEAGRVRERHLPFAIDLPGHGLIGSVGFAGAGDSWGFGYWLGKPFWGRGFATEAAQAALEWWENYRPGLALGSSRFLDNPSSGRVLEKLGFKSSGVVREQFSLARLERVPALEYRRPARALARPIGFAAQAG